MLKEAFCEKVNEKMNNISTKRIIIMYQKYYMIHKALKVYLASPKNDFKKLIDKDSYENMCE